MKCNSGKSTYFIMHCNSCRLAKQRSHQPAQIF